MVLQGIPDGGEYRLRILIVEDETDLAESLAEGLRNEGYLVDIAHDGADALVKP